jgi:hypothetical protein
MLGGITRGAQKQGNTKAVPVGRKSFMTTLVPDPIITQLFSVCQIHKKFDFYVL